MKSFLSVFRSAWTANVVEGVLVACAVVAPLVLAPRPASAAVPALVAIEGVLTGSGAVPVVDGSYDLTVAIYPGEGVANASWQEGPTKVDVVAGRFVLPLGAKTALSASLLAGLQQAWIGVRVGADPELPRVAMRATAYALVAAEAESLACSGCIGSDQLANGAISAAKLGFNYAGASTKGGAALDLVCSGCVSSAELSFDGDIDLAGNSIKAKNGTFSGDLVAKTVTAGTYVGDGSKLTGIAMPQGTCPNGQVVRGITPDGKLLCVDGNLPPDGLDEVSNGLLSNQFIDTISADTKNVPIPDNVGTDGISNLTFPDIGLVQTIKVTVASTNTDFSGLALTLLPPDDKGVGYTLCDPCAKDDTTKSLTLTLPPDKTAKGDLNDWVGKNPKGIWTLKAKDTSFCVIQKPGNATLCDTVKKTDGLISDWSITIQTLSSKKVAAKADIGVTGNVDVSANVSAAGTVSAGTNLTVAGAGVASNFQYAFINSDWRNQVADSKWKAIPGRTLTYTKTRATSVLRITYQDTLGSYANGYDRCRWRILVDTTQVAYFSDADLQYGTAWRMHNATHTALAAGVKPGKHTITVQSMMVPGGSECLMGWNTSQNFLAAEEVGL